MSKHQKGFTITELMVAFGVAAILTVVLFTISITLYGDTLRQQATAELAIESQTVLRRIVEDARTADAIHNTNLLSDANAPSGGWQTSDPNNVLIIAAPAIDSNRQIIYNSSDGFPYENEVIYFSQGTNMYRRTLKETAASGNTAYTTCPAALATATCPADNKLSEYLSNLQFVFYDINNNVTTLASETRSVSITVNMERKVYGRTITFSNTVRTTLRNY